MLYKEKKIDGRHFEMVEEEPTPVTAFNIVLHFDEQGSVWVHAQDEKIVLLCYRRYENYHVCDFTLDFETLADSYYSLAKQPAKQRWKAVQIVRMLRAAAYQTKAPGYAQQLARVGVL